MKLEKSAMMSAAKAILGDRNDDDAIKFIEDLNDTISEGENLDYKTKYEEQLEANKTLDSTWRKKYTERFFSPDANHTELTKTNPANTDNDEDKDPQEEALEQAKNVTFDDLFKAKEN